MIQALPVHTEEHAHSWYAATANRKTDYPVLEGQMTADLGSNRAERGGN